MKKVISLCLAVVMVLGMTTVAFATSTQTATAKGEYSVELNASVADNPVLISVVMPTSIDFVIETVEKSETMANAKGANCGATVSSGKAFKSITSGTAVVTNNSTGAIKLEVSSSMNTTGSLMNLVDLKMVSKGVGNTSIDNTVELEHNKDYTTGGVLAASIAGTADGSSVDDASINLTLDAAAAKANTGASLGSGDIDVNIPDGDYTIQTTLKVSLAA